MPTMLIDDRRSPTKEFLIGDEWVDKPLGMAEWKRRKSVVHASPKDYDLAQSLGFCGRPRSKNADRLACTLRAGQHTTHLGYGPCKHHGGALQSVKKAADMVNARRAVQVLGLPRDISPQTALLERVHALAGIVDWIEQILRGKEQESLVWGVSERTDDGEKTTVKEIAGPTVWLRLHQEYQRDLVKTCEVAIKCGLAERQVQLAESEGRLIARVIESVLRRLDIDTSQQKVRTIVGEVMRSVGPASQAIIETEPILQ